MSLFQYQKAAIPPATATFTTTPSLMLAEFPDSVVLEPPPPISVSMAEPILPPTIPYLSSWQSEWADVFPPPRLPKFEQTFQTPDRTIVTPREWSADYPDIVPGERLAIETLQTFAANISPISVPDSQLGWRGHAPSWLPTQRPVEFPAFTTGLTASSIPLVRPLVWLGRYPDRAPGARPLVDWQTLALNPSPISITVDQMGWRGYAPSWLPLLRPTEYPAFTTGLTASSIPLVRPLVWQGRYPDLAPGARAVAAIQSFVFDPFPRVVLTPLSWASEYPDMVARLAINLGPALAEVLGLNTFAPTGWLPTYPDAARVALGVIDTSQPMVLSSNVFVPLNSWASEFPDLMARMAQRPDSAGTAPFVQSTLPLLQAWLGRFADLLARPARVVDAQAPSPLATAITPFLSWLGRYPDRIDAAKRADLPATEINMRLPALNVPPLSWRAKYDDFARATRLATANMPANERSPSSSAFVVVTPNSWNTVYPSRAPGRTPINVGPSLFFVRLVVYGPANACFQAEAVYMPWFDLEMWLQPDVRPESATAGERMIALAEAEVQPSVTNERVLVSAFTDESVVVC